MMELNLAKLQTCIVPTVAYYKKISPQILLTICSYYVSQRSYEIIFYELFLCGHCFVQYGLSLHFLPILLVKLGFRLSIFQFFMFLFLCVLFLYLSSFALCFEFNVLIDLITQYSQSGNKINHVLFSLFSLYLETVTGGVL